MANGYSRSAKTFVRKRKRSEKSTRQIQDMQFVGESRLRRSTSKLECVRILQWFRNFRTSDLKELVVSAVRSVRRDSWTYEMAPRSEKSRLQIWPILQEHLKASEDSASEAHKGVSWGSWSTSTQEKKKRKIHAQIQGMQFVGESQLRRLTSTFECVRMFRWFRNIRYQNYLKYVILSA